MHEGDDQEGDRPADGRAAGDLDRAFRQQVADRLQHGFDQRLDQVAEGRLADPAQAQAGDGDAELGGRDVAIQVIGRFAHHARGGIALLDQGFDPRAAHADQADAAATKKAFKPTRPSPATGRQNCSFTPSPTSTSPRYLRFGPLSGRPIAGGDEKARYP